MEQEKKARRIKILLIEDDPFLLSMYSAKFEFEGYEIVTADNGAKGLIAAGKESPDIILLDILMPEMNGFEVLEKIKKNPKIKDIPIIILSNLNQKDDIEKGLAIGADDYLIKAHFMPSEVVDKIKKVLKI
jgi:DNA-binding response OmpR family regulator